MAFFRIDPKRSKKAFLELIADWKGLGMIPSGSHPDLAGDPRAVSGHTTNNHSKEHLEMLLVKVLNAGNMEDMGLYNIVGLIRKDYNVLGESNQGYKLYSLLKDLADDRAEMKGTKIKTDNRGPQPFTYNSHNVMHYSTGEKRKNPKKYSATIFFYKSGSTIYIIAAGHHTKASTPTYKITWGYMAGHTACV